MASFFLSYRRDDSAGFAGRLADDLEAAFGVGTVFRDVDDIRPGEDFVQAIESHMKTVDVVLVMIGPHWLTAGADGTRRLNDPHDFVRQEIAAALSSGRPIIPLLVGGAVMPGETDLPAAIAGLARRQAVVVSDAGWRDDLERLVKSLWERLPDQDVPVDLEQQGSRLGSRNLLPTLVGFAAMAVLLGAVIMLQKPSAVPVSSTSSTVIKPAVDVTGRWTAKVKYNWGDQHDEAFEFKYLGNSLHGTATYLKGRLTIEQVRLDGDWISFTTRSQEVLSGENVWKEVTHRYMGQVVGDSIRFTLETSGGYSIHSPVEFTAQR